MKLLHVKCLGTVDLDVRLACWVRLWKDSPALSYRYAWGSGKGWTDKGLLYAFLSYISARGWGCFHGYYGRADGKKIAVRTRERILCLNLLYFTTKHRRIKREIIEWVNHLNKLKSWSNVSMQYIWTFGARICFLVLSKWLFISVVSYDFLF